jgi:hypothetical protein
MLEPPPISRRDQEGMSFPSSAAREGVVAERNDSLGVDPYPIVQLLSWSTRCRTLGPKTSTPRGRQELRPWSPAGGPVSLGSMSVEAVSKA